MVRQVVLFDRIATSREPLLRASLQTEWQTLLVPDRTDLSLAGQCVAQAEAFIGNEFPSALTASARQLRLIHCVGAGTDLFELPAIPPGCTLCNVYEHEIPIAEYIMLCALMFATRVRQADAAMRRGVWADSGRHDGQFHEEVFGKTLGLIGFGHIGGAVAQRARAFGMKVLAVRRRVNTDGLTAPGSEAHPDLDWCGPMSELPQLLCQSDYVAIVCPLTPQTRGLLGEAELRLLKPTAVLINPARAGIVDEDALFRALSERWFAGAALDVWYQYPSDLSTVMHGSKHPFHELPNVLVTPHFSAWTEAMVRRRYQKIAENLDRLARGEPLERIVYQS